MAMAFNVLAQPIPQPVRHIPNFQPIDRCTELFPGSGQPDASKLQVTYLREGLRRKYVRKFLTTCYRYIRNAVVSYSAIPGFRMRFQIMAESGKRPQLDAPWYVPGCEVGLSKAAGELYSVVYECAHAAVQPGAYWPDVSGSVAGFHYPDWSVWNRSNDPVMAGVSGNWSTATAITLETLSGAAIGN